VEEIKRQNEDLAVTRKFWNRKRCWARKEEVKKVHCACASAETNKNTRELVISSAQGCVNCNFLVFVREAHSVKIGAPLELPPFQNTSLSKYGCALVRMADEEEKMDHAETPSKNGVFEGKLEVIRKQMGWEEIPMSFFVDKIVDDDDEESLTEDSSGRGSQVRARLTLAKESMRRFSRQRASKRRSKKRGGKQSDDVVLEEKESF